MRQEMVMGRNGNTTVELTGTCLIAAIDGDMVGFNGDTSNVEQLSRRDLRVVLALLDDAREQVNNTLLAGPATP